MGAVETNNYLIGRRGVAWYTVSGCCPKAIFLMHTAQFITRQWGGAGRAAAATTTTTIAIKTRIGKPIYNPGTNRGLRVFIAVETDDENKRTKRLPRVLKIVPQTKRNATKKSPLPQDKPLSRGDCDNIGFQWETYGRSFMDTTNSSPFGTTNTKKTYQMISRSQNGQ